MSNTIREVLEFVKENDVQFVRLGFCDPLGFHKNISIMSRELEHAFEHGVCFDAGAIAGYKDVAKSDLLLFPDPTTLTVLPWRPGPGHVVRFYCDIKNPDKTSYVCDGRYILRNVMKKYDEIGYACRVGAECEFYLFKADEDGEPTTQTLDRGGYLDISPMDKGENIRREVCLCLEEMGLHPESSHHEQGPGQNEIDFKFSDALSSADNLMTFKSVVKAVAARNGLFASFMPKPLQGYSGSGLHINLSLSKNGFNIFDSKSQAADSVVEGFIAGILAKTPEITLFLNPITNSYERFGQFEAPKYVSWSHQNRSQLVRIPAARGEKMRMELRSPDPTVNPYLAFALILQAGLYGIENNLTLPQAIDEDLYKADATITNGLEKLPVDLQAAIDLAKNSQLVRETIGDELLDKYIEIKQAEAYNFAQGTNKERFYHSQYFRSM